MNVFFDEGFMGHENWPGHQTITKKVKSKRDRSL